MVETLFKMTVGYTLTYVVKSYLIYSLLVFKKFLSLKTSSLLSSFDPGLLLLFVKQKRFHPDFPNAGQELFQERLVSTEWTVAWGHDLKDPA